MDSSVGISSDSPVRSGPASTELSVSVSTGFAGIPASREQAPSSRAGKSNASRIHLLLYLLMPFSSFPFLQIICFLQLLIFFSLILLFAAADFLPPVSFLQLLIFFSLPLLFTAADPLSLASAFYGG